MPPDAGAVGKQGCEREKSGSWAKTLGVDLAPASLHSRHQSANVAVMPIRTRIRRSGKSGSPQLLLRLRARRKWLFARIRCLESLRIEPNPDRIRCDGAPSGGHEEVDEVDGSLRIVWMCPGATSSSRTTHCPRAMSSSRTTSRR